MPQYIILRLQKRKYGDPICNSRHWIDLCLDLGDSRQYIGMFLQTKKEAINLFTKVDNSLSIWLKTSPQLGTSL